MSHQNDHQANENEKNLIGNILAEDNSGNHSLVLNPLWFPLIDSENEDSQAFKMGGYVGFGMPSSNVYGGAFNNVPDRVSSAPATDLNIVRSV